MFLKFVRHPLATEFNSKDIGWILKVGLGRGVCGQMQGLAPVMTVFRLGSESMTNSERGDQPIIRKLLPLKPNWDSWRAQVRWFWEEKAVPKVSQRSLVDPSITRHKQENHVKRCTFCQFPCALGLSPCARWKAGQPSPCCLKRVSGPSFLTAISWSH
jgi:hypothetical protein